MGTTCYVWIGLYSVISQPKQEYGLCSQYVCLILPSTDQLLSVENNLPEALRTKSVNRSCYPEHVLCSRCRHYIKTVFVVNINLNFMLQRVSLIYSVRMTRVPEALLHMKLTSAGSYCLCVLCSSTSSSKAPNPSINISWHTTETFSWYIYIYIYTSFCF